MKQAETVEIDGWTFYAGPWGSWIIPIDSPSRVPTEEPDPRRDVTLLERHPEWPTLDGEGNVVAPRSSERWPALRAQDKATGQRLLMFTTVVDKQPRRHWFLETEDPQEFVKLIEKTGADEAPQFRKGKYTMAKTKKSKPAARAATTKKPKASAKKGKAKSERKPKASKRALVFDRYTANGVLLLMGAKGFTVGDATAFLKSEKLDVSPITVKTRISTGRRAAAGEKPADRGEAANVSREDWSKIAQWKGKGGDEPKARAKKEAKPKKSKKAKPAKRAKKSKAAAEVAETVAAVETTT